MVKAKSCLAFQDGVSFFTSSRAHRICGRNKSGDMNAKIRMDGGIERNVRKNNSCASMN